LRTLHACACTVCTHAYIYIYIYIYVYTDIYKPQMLVHKPSLRSVETVYSYLHTLGNPAKVGICPPHPSHPPPYPHPSHSPPSPPPRQPVGGSSRQPLNRRSQSAASHDHASACWLCCLGILGASWLDLRTSPGSLWSLPGDLSRSWDFFGLLSEPLKAISGSWSSVGSFWDSWGGLRFVLGALGLLWGDLGHEGRF